MMLSFSFFFFYSVQLNIFINDLDKYIEGIHIKRERDS